VSRRFAAALAVVVLAAACGDDDEGSGAAVSSATTAPSASTTAGNGEVATTAVTGPTSTVAGPATATTTPASVPPEPPSSLDVGGVGEFAAALLRPALSERLVVEVHADVEPTGATLDHVAGLLADVSGKPVSVVAAGGVDGGDRAWTSSELRAAADAGSITSQGGGVAVVRLLFVRGSFEGDDDVLGVAVRGDVAAVFLDRVREAGGLLGGSQGIEVAVTAHEVGHLLGLVDLVLDTGRDDPEHPGHSRNRSSVMYWAVESSVVGQLLGADPPRGFDAEDRADLATIRAGA
jgi:hypothetical protein